MVPCGNQKKCRSDRAQRCPKPPGTPTSGRQPIQSDRPGAQVIALKHFDPTIAGNVGQRCARSDLRGFGVIGLWRTLLRDRHADLLSRFVQLSPQAPLADGADARLGGL